MHFLTLSSRPRPLGPIGPRIPPHTSAPPQARAAGPAPRPQPLPAALAYPDSVCLGTRSASSRGSVPPASRESGSCARHRQGERAAGGLAPGTAPPPSARKGPRSERGRGQGRRGLTIERGRGAARLAGGPERGPVGGRTSPEGLDASVGVPAGRAEPELTVTDAIPRRAARVRHRARGPWLSAERSQFLLRPVLCQAR